MFAKQPEEVDIIPSYILLITIAEHKHMSILIQYAYQIKHISRYSDNVIIILFSFGGSHIYYISTQLLLFFSN